MALAKLPNKAVATPSAGAALPPGLGGEVMEYWIDGWQRSILYWDVLRKRGNQTLKHYEAGKPPVLTFDYDLVMDGRDLERPCNYMLLRIRPEPGVEEDPTGRPVVIFDPRAGHGPGIGGMKEASQVGVAMHAGHPVYFVAFHPEPVAGQTIEDVAAAEFEFLKKVVELHPQAGGKPMIVGNCQAGWAIMMLSAYAPELPGLIAIAGAPLSYWAGIQGRDPMRYLGGLMGGTWMSSFAADLGNGVFDGAHLVRNFEWLNPANTHFGKDYNLYSKIDTEEARFLGFERWWTGMFFMTGEEIEFITNELFVGNKLTKSQVVARDGRPIDLANIRCPICVIASWGDNITPPPQALNWIADLYDSVEEIQANEQTIVYTLHPSIGHLGIFVSAKVAVKEHKELISSIDMIESLPPGLYEMVIEEINSVCDGHLPDHDEYFVRFEKRTIEDILALDDGRDDEKPFNTVRKMSEINSGLYKTFASPVVRALSNETTAQALRMTHPNRLPCLFMSDLNPATWWLREAAGRVRAERRAVDEDNGFRRLEQAMAAGIERSLEAYREARDHAVEFTFKAIWNNPFLQAMVGDRAPYANWQKPRLEHEYRELVALKLRAIGDRFGEGGFPDGVARILMACARADTGIDARAFRAGQKLRQAHPLLRNFSRAQVKEMLKEESFLVAFDYERAMATLPELLKTDDERREAVAFVRRVFAWRPTLVPATEAVLEQVEKILGLERRSLPAPAETPIEEPAVAETAEPTPIRRRAPARRKAGTDSRPRRGSLKRS
jgi:poly(3-hydroxyalkanoate) synthetase